MLLSQLLRHSFETLAGVDNFRTQLQELCIPCAFGLVRACFCMRDRMSDVCSSRPNLYVGMCGRVWYVCMAFWGCYCDLDILIVYPIKFFGVSFRYAEVTRPEILAIAVAHMCVGVTVGFWS